MFSRAPLSSSRSATTVRRSPVEGGKRQRPKSDTAARTQKRASAKNNTTKRGDKKDEDKKEAEISSEQILENCQENEYSRVFEISLHAQKLTRVPDLDEFSKLRILDLSCNQIKSVTGLENSPDIRELKLYSNKIEEITGLERLKELNHLLLHHNRIKAIGKSLQHVRKLKVLRLDSNLLSAISHIEIGCCSQLSILDISNNKLTNISAVNSLSALEELDVSANRLVKIPDISRCRNLQELDLSRNNIKDLSGLKDMFNLIILRIEHNQLTAITALGKLKNLQELYIAHNKLSSVETFNQQFPSLEILNICHNTLPSLECLHYLSKTSLAELSVLGNPFISPESTGYHQELHRMIPSLEMVDGVSLKRPTSSRGQSKPLMRPLSASHILSSRQVEEQLKAAMLEESSVMSSIASRFNMMKDLFDKLPTEPPKHRWINDEDMAYDRGATSLEDTSRPSTADRPTSRCSSRSRIADARAFAEEHFRSTQN